MEEEGGYDYEVSSEITNELKCMICLRLMKNPLQLACGHGMCKSCFGKLVVDAEKRYFLWNLYFFGRIKV